MDAIAFADELMGNLDPAVLAEGARVLGELGDERVLGLLAQLARSEDRELEAAAIGAIEQIEAARGAPLRTSALPCADARRSTSP